MGNAENITTSLEGLRGVINNFYDGLGGSLGSLLGLSSLGLCGGLLSSFSLSLITTLSVCFITFLFGCLNKRRRICQHRIR